MKPGSPEWARVMTASKVPAVLGLSPWESPRTMWLKMRGELSDDGSNAEAKSRGHYLEAGVIAWWLDRHPDAQGLERAPHRTRGTHRIRGAWAAATPDVEVADDGHGNHAVVEAKTAANDDDWGTPGTDEAPAYYVAQCMWQLWVTGAQIAYIPVLFGRPRLGFEEYVIQRDDALIDAIVARCRAFYDSLADDDAAPELSDHVAEYDAIRKAHPDIDRDAEAVIPDDIADRYLLDLAHEKRAPASKARLLDLMGRARIAKTESGLILARRQPKGDAVTLARVAALPDLNPAPEGIAS